MKITACSIVKNEAHNIARSIESYKAAVDEIIIVDTGSTDDTVEICKSYGATTLFYEWNNDFSAAKNYALEHAKGDWIIFLDADEWFVPKLKKPDITNVLRRINAIADGLLVTMCEFNDKTDKVYARELTTRIFRNSQRIRYNGSIHERLMNYDKEITQAQCPDIEIFHSGYANGLVEKKSKRNIDILYTIYNQGEIRTSLYYYLFRENYILGNEDEAIKFYELFMKQEDVDKVIKNDDAFICVYEFMYRIMVQNQGRYSQKELDCLLETAYKKYPKLPMHSYLLGCEKLRDKDYSASHDWLCNAINLNKGYSEPFSNSFVAYINDTYYKLGYISQKQGKLDQALSHYMEAIKGASTSDLDAILPKLINIIEAQPEEDIILFLNSLIDISKKEVVEAVLGALKRTRLHKAFVYYAIKYNQEFDGQDETTYIAMILMGQAEQVVETAVEASNNLKLRDDNTEGPLERLKEDNTSSFRLQESSRNINAIDFTEKGVSSNWHLDYAVVGTLYIKNINLYKKYQSQFSLEQKAIMRAYFEGVKIESPSQEIIQEHFRMMNLVCYILGERDLQSFKEVLNRGYISR